MQGRFLSVTGRIRNAVATWGKFCPEIGRKPRIASSSHAVAISNSQIRMKAKKKGLFRNLYDFALPVLNEDLNA